MSIQRWAAKRDANEPAIVRALERVGAKVEKLSGTGVCDLLVLFRGQVFMLEVKAGRGRATLAQGERSEAGWPVCITRTEDAALKAIGAIS